MSNLEKICMIATNIQAVDEMEFKTDTAEAKVLLVDNNKKQTSRIVNKLRNHFTVEICDNPVEGILKALGDNYSLLIISIKSASIDGIELCMNMKHNAFLKHVPLMILMDKYDKKKLAKSLKMGMSDCVLMPINLDELFAKVSLQIKKFKYQEKLRSEYIKVYITDMLTGLYNRKYLESYFSDILGKLQDRKDNYVLCILDIDDFKKINDNYGHATGDKVLQYVSKTIFNNIRHGDFVSRFGGEEFVVIFHELTVEKAKVIIERVRKKLLESTLLDSSKSNKISCTVSAGMDEIRSDDVLQAVLDRADKKLYKAKALGKNTIVA